MRHAGGPEHIPVGPVNGVLVAHHQGGDQACVLALAHPLENPVAHLLARVGDQSGSQRGIDEQVHPEADRGGHIGDLLDARPAALADHGLDMRTELRPGEVTGELQKELAAYDNSMLVLGTSNPAAIRWDWLKGLLEDSPQRAVLIVNSARAEATPDG